MRSNSNHSADFNNTNTRDFTPILLLKNRLDTKSLKSIASDLNIDHSIGAEVFRKNDSLDE